MPHNSSRRIPAHCAVGIRELLVGLLAALWIVSAIPPACGGEVQLKNGLLLEGQPVPLTGLTEGEIRKARGPVRNYPILMVDTRMKRYFVSRRQVAAIDNKADLSRYETFTLDQPSGRRNVAVQSLGTIVDGTPFDKFGRRRVTVNTPRGPKEIVQVITQLHPKRITISALKYEWEYRIATTSLEPATLEKILRQATDQSSAQERMAIARFYLQAGLYRRGDQALEAIVRDFPELTDRVDTVREKLRGLWAQQLLGELRRRREAGQFRLAYNAARQFPTEKMSASVRRDVRRFLEEYRDMRDRAERSLILLGELQAGLEDPERVAAVKPLRSVVNRRLDFASLDRMDAFLNLVDDDSLSPAEKLALAYSGWVLGSAEAVTDLEQAIRLWEARHLITEYLRTDNSLQRDRLLEQVKGVEGIGPATVARLIPRLPLPLETSGIRPGTIAEIKADEPQAEAPVSYHALLPREYTPHHDYPLIVALHGGGGSSQSGGIHPAEREVQWWGGNRRNPGQAQRHGFIVVAPHYAEEGQNDYNYAPRAHERVLRAIRDARKRFSVDSDRVFLGGHGTGGDAAFDIGMSHPDVFAGVMPIAGISDMYTKWYWQNAENLAWYVVGGELDRDWFDRNSREMSRMMRKGYDVLYTEYVGRGYESYYEEIHKLFDWMGNQQRTQYVDEIDAEILRPEDSRFYWVEVYGLPQSVLTSEVLPGSQPSSAHPMPLEASIKDGDPDRTIIYVRSGADHHVLRLSPDLVDFDKRLAVRHRGRQRFNDFLVPSIRTMLEDLRRRGDRQKIVWAEVEFD